MKTLSSAVLSALALACATLAAYWLSLLWRGASLYRFLMAPISGAVMAAILLLAVVACINRGRHNKRAIIVLTAALSGACALTAAAIFFAVLDNCRLACGPTIEAESKNQAGDWRAIQFSTTCVSIARDCPSITQISIVRQGGKLVGVEGNTFSTGPDGMVQCRWTSDHTLLIDYWPAARILRQRDRIGPIRIEYRPMGIM